MKPCLHFTSLKQYNIILSPTLEYNEELPTLSPHYFPIFPILPPHYRPIFPNLPPHILSPFPACHLTTLLHFSHLPSSLLPYLSQLTTIPKTNRSLQNSNFLPLGRQGKQVWLIARQLLMKAGCWWDAPLTLRDLAKVIIITRSKISYSLIKPQPLLCTPACSHKSHALAAHPHPKFTAPPVRSAFGIRSEVFGGTFLRKQSTP